MEKDVIDAIKLHLSAPKALDEEETFNLYHEGQAYKTITEW